MVMVVTGSRGMLGREFMEAGLGEGHRMVGFTRQELDLERPGPGLEKLAALKPDAVIHCAAETDVDLCETKPEWAREINAEAAGRLAEASRALGAHFAFISTSGLFDGSKPGPFTEKDAPNPPTAYGKSKLAGERRVLAAHPEALVLRAGWLFGGPLELKKNFVGARVREAEGKQVIFSATDKRGSPTWTKDFAERALSLLREGRKGLLHLVNAGVASRFEYVREIARLAHWRARVEPADSARYPRRAPVPSDESLQSLYLAPLRSWKHALEDYLGNPATGSRRSGNPRIST